MEKKRILICDVISSRKQPDAAPDFTVDDFEAEDDRAEDSVEVGGVSVEEVPVDFSGTNVMAIDIPMINDEHGRISDVIEALEEATGLSVIPLKMGNVSEEVCSLARHKIYDFEGKRFAMSYKLRRNVVDGFVERIMKALSSGIPFIEDLNTSVIYDGQEYETLALSEVEWTELMAKFRNYKERLFISGGKFTMEIQAERV